MTTIKWVLVVMFLSILMASPVWEPTNPEPPAQMESGDPPSSDPCCRMKYSCCEINSGGGL